MTVAGLCMVEIIHELATLSTIRFAHFIRQSLMELIRSTLVLPEVWSTISQFQCGVRRAILPFLKVRTIPSKPGDFDRWFQPLQAKLDMFYADYGTTRLDELVRHLPSMKDNLMIAASAANDVAILEILHEQFDLLSCQRKLLNVASKCGNMEALIYLHNLGHPGCSDIAMDLAARNDHLDIVKFLHSNRKEGCTAQAINLAAKFGHLDFLEWLYVNKTTGSSGYAMDHAASLGHLAIVQRLHDRGFLCSERAMESAIENEHIQLVEWLHANRTEGFRTLPMNMSVKMIQWLCVNRCDFDPGVCLKQAVSKNNIDAIELLVDRFDVPWSEELTQEAKRKGTLASLRWIHNKNLD
ncbi:unnamed protein product [Aphanomyces euteiches]|uniref:Uncharacterized protein n=1 Tax=Aphanomyces euteiches TaxID=100861 RepID=A0A6G0XEI2_9STRA|nr:hypothetical protein Ae201684_005575 [Aphanomyces euteiches]KAH9078814.1 hypothetical protein Ae201684P_019884 [Aphanomyces euteiches]KAH9142406.1 hypothetical protein AeRB84_013514 [Aphanomyces euteiches]